MCIDLIRICELRQIANLIFMSTGVGVMMLLALTVERYVSVCHPGQYTRPLCGPPNLTVALIPIATFLVYIPSVFRGEITTCLLDAGGPFIYQKRDSTQFLNSVFYQVSISERIFRILF